MEPFWEEEGSNTCVTIGFESDSDSDSDTESNHSETLSESDPRDSWVHRLVCFLFAMYLLWILGLLLKAIPNWI